MNFTSCLRSGDIASASSVKADEDNSASCPVTWSIKFELFKRHKISIQFSISIQKAVCAGGRTGLEI